MEASLAIYVSFSFGEEIWYLAVIGLYKKAV